MMNIIENNILENIEKNIENNIINKIWADIRENSWNIRGNI